MKRIYLVLLFISFPIIFNLLKASTPTTGAQNPSPIITGSERWKIRSLYGYYGEETGGGISVGSWGGDVSSSTASFGGNECIVIKKAAANAWGAVILKPKQGDYFDFSGDYNKLNFQVWADSNSSFEMELINDDWDGTALTVTGFTINQWTVYSVTIPQNIGDLSKIRGIVFIPNYATDKPYYIDNIYLSRTTRPANEPSNWLTPPVRFAGSYLSIYNDQPYGNASGDFDGVWNSSTFNYLIEEGQHAKKMTYNGQGAVQYTLPSALQDLSAYTYMHFDIWPVEALTSNQLSISMYIPGGDWNDGSALTIGNTASAKQWTGIDLKLSDFTNPKNFSNIENIRFETPSGTSNPKIYYIDNVYFYKVVVPTESAPTPTHTPTSSVYSDTYSSNLPASWGGVTDGNVNGNNYKRVTNLQSGANITLNSNANISAGNILHMDVWVEHANSTELTLQLFDGNGTESNKITISNTQFQEDKWNRINVLLSDFGSGSVLNSFRKLELSGSPSAIYVDNVYFYSESPVTTVAPAPSHTDTENIMVIYSEAFRNAVYNPGAGFSTKGSIEKQFTSTNKYRMLSGMSEYANIDLGTNGISSSEWQFIHMDARSASGTSNLDIFIEGTKLDGTSGATALSQEIKAENGWTKVDLSSSTAQIPLGSKIKSLKVAARTGFLFLDNIYLYKSASSLQQNVVSVEGANENNSGEVNKLYSSLFEAFHSISNVDQTGATINVLIHKDSKEDRKITVFSPTWNSLTIKPTQKVEITFQPLASLDQTSLLEFINTQKLTIDGNINGTRSLTFKGYYNETASYWAFDMNSIIRLPNNEVGTNKDIVIQNCIFTNPDLDRSNPNRSVSAITGTNVENIKILNNEFRNCLSLNVPNSETVTGVIDLQDIALSTINSNDWTITGNHFYETEADLPFNDLSYIRTFIRINLLNNGTNVLINENIIGGNSLNGSGNFSHSGVSTHLMGIYTSNSSVVPTANIKIKNNVISNINFDNQTTSFNYSDENGIIEEKEQLASFVGIDSRNGKVEISENTIENISWKAKEFNNGGVLTNALIGINYSADASIINNIICYANKIGNINFKMSSNGNNNMVISYEGIKITAAQKVTAEISNNSIIWGLDDTYTYNVSSSINGIFVHDYSTNTTMNIFNNLSVITKFKAGGNIYNISAYWLYIQNPLESAVTNFYNNIAYVQGGSSDYTNPGVVNGIRCVYYNTLSADKINFYHNTSFVNNIGGSQGSTAIVYDIEKEGKMNSWNNNFVNMNANGTILRINDSNYSGGKNPIAFDYNNYYSPKTPNWEYLFASGYSGTTGEWVGVQTFDNWKFENPIWLIDKSGRQDFHSTVVNPKFNGYENNNISIPFTFDGVYTLKSLLKPTSLIAGSGLSSLPGTASDINGTPRQINMPTNGAIELELPNCWLGNVSSDWENSANWTQNTVPGEEQDITFHPNAQNNLVLDRNRAIRNILNGSAKDLLVNGHELSVSGIIRMEGAGKVDAFSNENSKIVYKPGINLGAVVQHLYKGVYKNDKISNLTLTNQTNYHVLLYDKLEITNLLTVTDGNGNGTGGLNCYFFNTDLKLSGTTEIPQYTIYNDTVYNLIIDGVKVTTNQDNIYVKNNLTINQGKSFEISAEKFVKVDGETNNSNGVHGLIIKSEKEKANATFIFKQNNSTKIEATVEMYSKSSMEGKPANEYVWQYFGIPVTRVQADLVFSGSYVREWNIKGNNTDLENFYWKELKNGDIMAPFNGYEVSNPEDKTVIFRGELVKEDKSFLLPHYSSAVEYDGQYILSNPYTASIKIDNLQFGDDMDKTVYLYNTGSYNDWVSGGSGVNNQGDAPGRYLAIPQNQAGSAELSGEIPSMQGFLVKSNTGGSDVNKYMTIAYSSVVSKNTTQQRVAEKNKSSEDKIYTIIDIDMESDNQMVQADRMWLFTEENCTRGFDNGWDGPKVLAPSLSMPQIYAVEKDIKYQVSSMSNIDNTTIGFIPGESERYTLRFRHQNAEEKYGNIYLLDFIQKSVTDITENNSEYTFTAEGNELVNRFKIITRFSEDKDNWLNTTSGNSLISFYVENKTVYVLNPTDYPGNVYIYDLNGRSVYKGPISPQNITMVPLTFTPGVHLIRVNLDDNSEMAEKIILK